MQTIMDRGIPMTGGNGEAEATNDRAVHDAQAAERRLRDAIDILPEGIVFLDAAGRYILWNQQYADIYKRSADLFKVGVRLEDTLRIGVARGDYPESAGREEAWISERLAKMRNPGPPHEQVLSDGRVVLIEERMTSDGGTIGLRVDITEMKQREASFRLLFDSNPLPMFVCAADGERILAANDAAIAHYGYDRETLVAGTLADIHDPSEGYRLSDIVAPEDWQAGQTWRHRKADGSIIDVAVFARRLTYERVPAVLMAVVDITERKRAEARIRFMAHHDALTELPNRLLLHERMDDMLSRLKRNGTGLAVHCIDIDNFKTVNDSLGHPVGDRLLQAVAARLRAAVRQEDLVARLGGDEFAILQADIAQAAEASCLAGRVLAVLAEPFDLDGNIVSAGASIGVAIAPGDGGEADELLKNADMALYRAKGEGKGTFRFFEAEMDARARAHRQLELDLRAALRSGDLQVHYQPLIQLATGAVTGCEALVRWRHPERGMVAPAEFVAVAEETGLIGPLGAFVLGRACADAARWPEPIKVAVNLSPLQFRSGNLLSVVTQALEASGLAPSRLELEITETLLLDKSGVVLATLHALRELGINISMDDFGTGYSSLSYLRSFPFDKIKIDRSFVQDMGANADSQAIVKAIIGLGASLGITITAEGIESVSDLERLRQEGCDEGQGYLFSKARPNAEIVASLMPAKRVA